MKKRKNDKKKKLGYNSARLIRKVEKGGSRLWLLLLPFSIIGDALSILFRIFLILSVIVIIVGGIAGVIMYNRYKPVYDEYSEYAKKAIEESSEETFALSESSYIYDVSGNVIARLSEGTDAQYLTYRDIPEYAVDAFIAVEDRSFWENPGYDRKGIIRVILQYIKTGGNEKHGASTITQQLARNVFLSHERSLERKAKELLLAIELTKKYSKRKIMEYYINDICYANNIYGLGSAAKNYFDKGAEKLTLSETAYLCAIPNSPEYYNPYKYPERAIERRDKILLDMLECNFITESEYNKAIAEKITITKPKKVFSNYETTFALDSATRYMMGEAGFEFRYSFDSDEDYKSYMDKYNSEYELVKDHMVRKGYRIYTSLDMDACSRIQEILDEKLSFDTETDDDGVYALQGAVTVVDNDTGKVVALTGGRTASGNSASVYSLNRAYQAYRQPGSSIKPLVVYTPALENGYTMDSEVMDIDVDKAKEILKERGQPGLSEEEIEKLPEVSSLTGKTMPLRTAVEKSINGVAWKLFDELTPDVGLKYLTDMEFQKIVPDDYYDSAALGGLTNGVTTVEMAGAYSALVNHGRWAEPDCILSIKTVKGKELYRKSERKTIYKAYSADDMIEVMQGVIEKGTAASLKWSKSSSIPAACKTGTTNNSKDGWLCGVTPYYSIAVWVGYDQPATLDNLWGSTYPGEIWKESMLYMVREKDPVDFERDEDDPSYEESVSRNKAHKAAGAYDWLEGRSDDELLSDGYTVGQYKADHAAGAQVELIVSQMNALNRLDPNYPIMKQALYNQGLAWVNVIYGLSYKAEELNKLNSAWAVP